MMKLLDFLKCGGFWFCCGWIFGFVFLVCFFWEGGFFGFFGDGSGGDGDLA